MTKTTRILGIDPGLVATGWGVIDQTGPRLTHVAHGVVRISPDLSLAERVCGIHDALRNIIREYNPANAGIEETLVNASPRSALKLGQARGAALVALAGAGLTVFEFAPRKIKLSVVGTGKADKEQVGFMVARLLPRAGKMCSDSADALACAICTAHHRPLPLARRIAI